MRVLRSYIIGITFGSVAIVTISPISVQSVEPTSPEKSDFHMIFLNSFPSETDTKEEALTLFDLALERWEKIERNYKSIETLSYIATRLAKAGFTDRAEIVFDRALKLSKHKQEGFYNNLYRQDGSLRDVVTSMVQAGFCDRALEEARKIASPLARAEALHEIAKVFIDRNNLESAREILLEAARAAKAEEEFHGSLSNGSCHSPKHLLLSQIAQNLSRIFELQSALNIAKDLRNCYGMSEPYLAVAYYKTDAFEEIIENSERVEEVREIWIASQEISHKIDVIEAPPIWSMISHKLLEMGEYNFAILIARKLTDPFQIPDRRNSTPKEIFIEDSLQTSYLQNIATALVKNGEFERAKQLIQLIPKDDIEKSNTLIEVAIAQRRLLDDTTEEAIARFLTLLPYQTLCTISSLCEEFILHLMAIDKEEQAIQVFNAISEYQQPWSLFNIRTHFAKEGKIDQALNFWDDRTSLRDHYSGLSTKVWEVILSNATRPEKIDKILDFWSDRTGLTGKLWADILAKITRLDRVEEALEIAKKHELGQDFIRGRIGIQLIKLGEIERGYHLVDAIESRKSTEGHVYENTFKVGLVKEAIALLVQQDESEKALELLQNTESTAIDEAKLLADFGFYVARKQ